MCSPFSSTVDGQFLAEWATISSATEISRSRGSARLTRNPANSGCRRGVAELDTHDRFGRGRVRAAPRQVDIVSIIGVEGIVRGAGYRPVGGHPGCDPKSYDVVSGTHAEFGGQPAGTPPDRASPAAFAETVCPDCGPGHRHGLGREVFGVDLSMATVGVARRAYPTGLPLPG